MMYRYRNANTGDVVEYLARSVRLDHLPNWSLVDAPAPPTPAAPAEPPVDPAPVERPTRRAPVAEWRAYALACGADADQVEQMSKAELVEFYGG